MHTTRDLDLQELEEARDKGVYSAKVALEKAYKQSRNSDIERGRRMLIEAHKRGDLKEIARLEELIYRYGR